MRGANISKVRSLEISQIVKCIVFGFTRVTINIFDGFPVNNFVWAVDKVGKG
jgi:hypothetical protein